MRIGLGIILSILLSFPALALDLPLQGRAQVGGSQVLLRDLVSQDDAARLEKLSGPIRLFRSPEPGMTRKVSRQTLARLVSRQVKSDQLRLTGAGSVTISRKGIWIEPEEMDAILSNYLTKSAQELPGVELSFKHLYLPPRYMVPEGQITHQVIPSKPQVIGSRRMTLITRVDDRVVANQAIRVEVVARAQVVVVTSDLRRGDRLTAENLRLQPQEITHLEEPFFSFESLLGKKLKQFVRIGEPLERRQVEFPPLIKRGARVTIQLRSKGLRLTASGEARQNGERGDTIRVRNIRSQREVLCRVQDAGLVSVEF